VLNLLKITDGSQWILAICVTRVLVIDRTGFQQSKRTFTCGRWNNTSKIVMILLEFYNRCTSESKTARYNLLFYTKSNLYKVHNSCLPLIDK